MRLQTIAITLVVSTVVVTPAWAGHGYHGGEPVFFDKARVVDVVPIRELVRVDTPRRECWQDEVERTHHHGETATYTLIGTIIGGVVGNQFGKGKGRKVATVAGTLIGAAVGSDIGKQKDYAQPYTVQEQHCRVADEFYEEERTVGYRVTYKYRGRTFTQRMHEHPDKYVRIRVALDVAE